MTVSYLIIFFIFFFLLSGLALNCDWIESFIFLLLIFLIFGFCWLMSSWNNLFGLLLLLVYSGGIAILIFFFLFLYGWFLYENLLWFYSFIKLQLWFNFNFNLLFLILCLDLIFLNVYIELPLYFNFFYELPYYYNLKIIRNFYVIFVCSDYFNNFVTFSFLVWFYFLFIDFYEVLLIFNVATLTLVDSNMFAIIYNFNNGIFTFILGLSLFFGICAIIDIVGFWLNWSLVQWNYVMQSKFNKLKLYIIK